MDDSSLTSLADVSLSARRAWIEIAHVVANNEYEPVALRKESVDRNDELNKAPDQSSVALRKESVDRNNSWHRDCHNFDWSLSARRAWIEIAGFVIGVDIDQSRSPQGERG